MNFKKWTKKEMVKKANFHLQLSQIEWIEKGVSAKIYDRSTKVIPAKVQTQKKCLASTQQKI